MRSRAGIAILVVVVVLLLGGWWYTSTRPDPAGSTGGSVAGCYVATLQKDVYTLTITSQSGTEVSGTLSYKNFEKDSSSGVFTGTYEEGILHGEYAFRSEGMDSIREVIFKRIPTGFIQGFGPVATINNKEVFSDQSAISYDTSISFIKQVSCSDQEVTMCTMDALMCPDGSSVGRSGPQCTFAACPSSSTSYTGTLTKQGEVFTLVIGAPIGVPGEVTYALPLEVKVSNALAQLVGRTVKAYGTFKTGNTLVVDTLQEVSKESVTRAEVGIGETKYINGVRITLHSVVQDNRCPIDVQCIEGGAITARVTLKSDTDTETFNMASDEVPHRFDSFKVAIVDVKPARVVVHVPDTKSYRVTFEVTK